MPSNREAKRKKAAAQARKDQRVWVSFKGHPKGGFWYASSIPMSDHGTWNTYNNWYCRCYNCMDANRFKQQEFVTGKVND